MAYDPEIQHLTDQKHLDKPLPGDFWHEMCCPVARVLDVSRHGFVILQKVSGYGGKEITEADPAPCIMTLPQFREWLSYETIPDRTWAHVIPERYPVDPVSGAKVP